MINGQDYMVILKLITNIILNILERRIFSSKQHTIFVPDYSKMQFFPNSNVMFGCSKKETKKNNKKKFKERIEHFIH